jgi:FkbM family methyltransferase
MEVLLLLRIFNFIFTRVKNVLPGEKLAEARQLVLKNCDFVVDVGANSGQWISEVKNRGYKGAALCIEPIKKNYADLKARNLDNTTTLNCAVGNKNGYININLASNDGLSSSILEFDSAHKNAAPKIKFAGKEKVKMLKLSKILEKKKHKKMYIKIDTQGYEFEILKSINKKTFNNIYGFEIETSIVSTYKNVVLIEDVIKFLRKKGFQPLRLENGFGMPNFGQQLQTDIIFVQG